ncbi:hypothetical protein H4R26_000869 [Coemansia thaxteri]|uniref:PSP proline-rich domain-containing protein n=1 Tax=Coemansia thaxteri TaxID=2663907 RepID=A0A9W8BFW9_9FUNG|nr:hypothetical protein H4R26_000869 [Coemansia thaxteri]KAJ2487154.1 hypothetical protein EV174_000696 [Coemansia sp. RSA 2320]
MALAESTAVKDANSSAALGNKRRKKKTRKEKQVADEERSSRLAQLYADKPEHAVPEDVKIEYVEQQPNLEDTEFAEYSTVFSQFASNATKSFGANEEEEGGDEAESTRGGATAKSSAAMAAVESRPDDDLSSDGEAGDDDDIMNGGESAQRHASRKQKKRERISVAELKQMAPRPEVVEWTDVSAPDPGLLVALKAARNTVPVPIHWSQKKKYLQYKRGMEKPPFDLPDFIKATGIMEMREAVKDKEDEKRAKTTARERTRPKMNKLTLDYQRLHDAFFRFQTLPKNLTGHGDLFYEGKESDMVYSFTPGILSDALKTALSIPPLAPPPWLVNMQRYGPPPSYPDLVIPGLNAPIPSGAQWGYHPGGWGRPPVDETGHPLYGDVFAAPAPDAPQAHASYSSDGVKMYWGDLEADESSEDEDEESEASEGEEDEVETGPGAQPTRTQAAATAGAAAAASIGEADRGVAELTDEQLRSGMASMPSGLETPSVLQLRKQQAVATANEGNKSLYTILPEQATARLEGFMASQYTYDMSKALDPAKKAPPVAGGEGAGSSGRSGDSARMAKAMGSSVHIALDASELEGLDENALQAKYDEAAAAASLGVSGGAAQEDLSDMVAEHAAAQTRKRRRDTSVPAPKRRSKN